MQHARIKNIAMQLWSEASEELLAHAQSSEEGFIQLYNLYAQRILRFVLVKTGDPELAQDITQETFISVHRFLPRYRLQGKPFSSWLLQIAHNHIRSHFRKRSFEYLQDEVLAHIVDPASIQPDLREQRIDLLRALQQCSEKEYTILHLKCIEDLPNEEIARILGISVTACGARIHRALKRLQKHLSIAIE